MAGSADDDDDDDDYSSEQIALELKLIADFVRQGPLDPDDLEQLIARVEKIAQVILHHQTDPDVAKRLEQLAEQLRTAPTKRKNGHSS